MIYLFTFLLILFFSFRFDYVGKNYRDKILEAGKATTQNKRFCFILICFLLICIAGFRYRIGGDSVAYERLYTRILPLFEFDIDDLSNSEYEPLYYLLGSIAKFISPEFWVLQLLQSLLVNIVIFRFIWKNIDNRFTGVLIYYFFLFLPFTCETMREACAVSMVLLGWEFLKKDKWLKFTFFLVLAVGFHISALPLLIIPLLKVFGVWKYMKVNSFTLPLLIISTIVGYIILKVFFDYIILLNITENLNSKAESYMSEAEEGLGLNMGGILSKVCQYALFVYISVRHFKFSNKSLPNNLEPLILLCLIVQCLSFSITILYRYNNYLMPFTLICIADMFYDKRLYISKKTKFVTAGFLIWFIIYFPAVFFHLYGLAEPVQGTKYKQYMNYYPYSSVFTKDVDPNREHVFQLYGN